MSLKKVLYKKYGIMISEAEASYYAYLLSNSKKKYDYLNVLNEFIDNCETRYFGRNKVKEIKKELIKEEIGRNIQTSRAPNGKGAAGNITRAEIVQFDLGLIVEPTVDTSTGKDVTSIVNKEKNTAACVEIDEESSDIFIEKIRVANINNNSVK
jgi:hypothetical protein